MSSENKSCGTCGPACTCSPCVCRHEAEPASRPAGYEDAGSSARQTACTCGR